MNITAVATAGDFASRGSIADPAGRGWEYVVGLDLAGNAPRWAEEAVMKLRAPSVEAGTWDLVLHPSNLWLTIHESIGHPTELDRALGYEANYAGTSFLAPPDQVLNRFQIGQELMTFMGNRTEEGGCATVGWDDEGVAPPPGRSSRTASSSTTRRRGSRWPESPIRPVCRAVSGAPTGSTGPACRSSGCRTSA